MTFYVDLIYLSCFAMNFLILHLHSKFLSVKIKQIRIIIAAAFSGILSLQSLILGRSLILLFFETLIILRTTYGKCTYPELFRRFFILLGIIFVFGAVMNLFSVFYTGMFIKNNIMYAVLPIPVFIFGSITAVLILYVFLFFIRHRRMLYKILLVIDNEVISTTAFLDTGNRLKEPKRKRPVVIIEEGILKGEHNRESIFLKTVGKEQESIDMVYVKSLTLLDENRKIYDLYAGIAEHPLSKNGEFHALLHSDFAN